MENKEKVFTIIQELRIDNARKQQKGLHFIMTSVLIWMAIFIIQMTNLPILTKNMYTMFCSAPLFPVAYLLSRMIKVDFQNKENPLTKLGMILALNQMIYMLIAMWIFYMMPEYLVMVYAIIVGAHFLPYSWLYRSKVYIFFSIVMPVVCFLLGMRFAPWQVAAAFFIMEVGLCVGLLFELRKKSVA